MKFTSKGLLNEANFYITYNKGRGQGKALLKSSSSNWKRPQVFNSYKDAEKYIGNENKVGMTAYWVSDDEMNRINKYGEIEETKLTIDGKSVESVTENTSTISKKRAQAELKQQLKGTRDDGMGKYTAIVYGMDDGKRVELKSMNDINKYSKFEIGDNKHALKPKLTEMKVTDKTGKDVTADVIKKLEADLKKRGYKFKEVKVNENEMLVPEHPRLAINEEGGFKEKLTDFLTSEGVKYQIATGIGAIVVGLSRRPELIDQFLTFFGLKEGTCGYDKTGDINPKDTSSKTPGGLKSMPADKRTQMVKKIMEKIKSNKS